MVDLTNKKLWLNQPKLWFNQQKMWFNQRKWWFQPTKLVCFRNQLIAKLPSFDQLSQCHGCLLRSLFSIFPWMIYNHLGSSSKTFIIYCEAIVNFGWLREVTPQKKGDHLVLKWHQFNSHDSGLPSYWSSVFHHGTTAPFWSTWKIPRSAPKSKPRAAGKGDSGDGERMGKGVEFLRNLVANLIMSYPYHPSVVLYDNNYIYIIIWIYVCICIHYVVFVRVFHYMMYRIHSELFFMGCRLGIFLDMYVLSISLTETPGDLS
jgi:hypothetical protein